MKAKHLFITLFLLFFNILIFAQPNWSQIKANFAPVYDTSVYNNPYIQPHTVGGWEDGVYITRDGRYLYCFYAPVDILSYAYDIDKDTNNPCPNPIIAPYWRGPAYGIDTTNYITSCSNGWLHSDVLYIDLWNQTSWQTTDINDYGFYEGAPQIVDGPNGTVDAFLYTRTTDEYEDLYIMRNVSHNPTDIAERIDTINIIASSGAETNPHMEHINGSTYVLFIDDSHENNPNGDIHYSISNDSGYTWTPLQPVTSINSNGEELMPHLWFDGTDWWLYYATSDPSITGVDWRLHIVRRKQLIANDWNSWGPPEIIVAPGSINGGYGQVLAVGEPTLTQWGDLSFSVIYGDTTSSDTTDVYDSDPWFLPKKGSPLALYQAKNKHNISVYPNPAKDFLNIDFNKNESFKYKIYNSIGQLITDGNAINSILLSTKYWEKGLYIVQISNQQVLTTRKIIIN